MTQIIDMLNQDTKAAPIELVECFQSSRNKDGLHHFKVPSLKFKVENYYTVKRIGKIETWVDGDKVVYDLIQCTNDSDTIWLGHWNSGVA